jgi:hypothetical protein
VTEQSYVDLILEIATPLGFDTPLRDTQPAGLAMTHEIKEQL